ncbi:MAG: hypothetical protein N3A61_07785, partial [Ignavibacteria bacterium]|nr:hypothetical protein [Ignavibacteria bacterium]
MKIINLVLFVFINVNILISQTVQISALRNNNANGVPVDSGQVFTITGIVTVGNEFNSPSYLQDNTAGIAVFARGSGQFSSQVQIGDSVVIRGKLSHFRGLTQFDSVASFSKISSGKTVIPTILTIADILSQNWNGYEAYEGMLIRVNNVTVTGSGNWTGNTNYQINDGTGTSYLRIVAGTNLVGQPIPTSSFDLVGALGAFKTSAPYDQTSYQILPRNLGDIITDNKPLIVLPVIASNIDTSSFRVYFETLRNGDTEARYGLTEALELGQVKDTTKTKHHSILVHSLNQQTKYYFKALSSNSFGTSEGPIQTVTTASSNPLTGTINVYFNYSVDKTVAVQGNEAKGNVDFTDKLLQRINSASYSIDMALYSFYNQNTIVNALISARNRG